ncbi:TetR/AcrR family transcriptional regulator [Winogradskyella alexanderae]|uniref:TetR/AcrR family transcriptional regulator n=1 Tax=Winogradskyella alexanderae TaxID=2877123 RepID=A0ABS7XWX9_9FLAO|nr:TetR/AcrR family transcriptional regulator [Winogradskyella alexanderae]MCA0133899.1 TetR/AcrR family transcriptional regulator [Winogradskyella alexanderae]
MKKTKQKIADTALHLFNMKGLSQVTLRTIAKEMGISQGNLNYHYKKREDIIEEIYYRLVKEMDDSMDKIKGADIGLTLFSDITAAVLQNSFKYRFFFFDFIQIMRENKKIKRHYKSLVDIRKTQIITFFDQLVQGGLMREEQLPNEYTFLYKRFQIFGDFWMASAEIEKKQISEKTIVEYLEIITQSIYPYLTEKGIKEYNSLNF